MSRKVILKSILGWHALSPSEGRGLVIHHALRSSGRATQIQYHCCPVIS
jgi:hypothetical protein